MIRGEGGRGQTKMDSMEQRAGKREKKRALAFVARRSALEEGYPWKEGTAGRYSCALPVYVPPVHNTMLHARAKRSHTD